MSFVSRHHHHRLPTRQGPDFAALESRLLLDAADLVVADIFRDPAQAEPGQVVTLVAEVLNDSTAPVDQSFYADFTANGLSLTGGGGFLVDHGGSPIAPGGSIYITCDYVYTGVWPVIGVEIDLYDQVAEQAEDNNTRTENFSIPSPDLAVVSLEASSRVVAEGDRVAWTAVIKNIADAGTVRDFTIAWSVNRGEGWQQIAVERITKDFNVGTELSRKITLPAEFDLTQVKLSVDVLGEIDEVNEWNNDGLDQLNVPHPDLVVGEISLRVDKPMSAQDPETPWDGQRVTFTADILNIAPGGTGRDYNVRFVVDAGTAGETDLGTVRVRSDLIARAAVAPVEALKVAEVSLGGWVASPGEHTITVVVDCDGEIPERYEFNNAFASVAAAPAPIASAANVAVVEGDAGVVQALIPVTLSQPAARTVGLYYHTEDGSALAGSDYRRSEGVLNLAAGQSQALLAIDVYPDGLSEQEESFYLRLYGEEFVACSGLVVEVTVGDSSLTVVDDALDALEDQLLTIDPFDLMANDLLGNGAYMVGSVGQAVGGSVVLADGMIVFTPLANFAGQASFVYGLNCGGEAVGQGHVSITVAGVDDAPVAADDLLRAWQATSWPANALLGNDLDDDGDWLTLAALGGASHCTVALEGGRIVFEPEAGFTGTASFSYTVVDPTGLDATAHAEVVVSDYLDYLAAAHTPVRVTKREPLSFLDADGEKVKLSMGGPGEAWVYFDVDIARAMADPLVIELRGGSASTTLKMKTSGRGAQTTLGTLLAEDQAVGKVVMQQTVLNGSGLAAGQLSRLYLAGVAGGADILIDSTPRGGFAAKISGRLGDGDGQDNRLVVGGEVKLLKVGQAAADALIEAATLTTLASSGDFYAGLTVTGASSSGYSLKKAKISGAAGVGNWQFAGAVATISVASWGGGGIACPALRTLKVKRDMMNADLVVDDLDVLKVGGELADSTLALGDSDGDGRGRVLVKGWMREVDLLSTAGLKQIQCGGLDGCDIAVGLGAFAAAPTDAAAWSGLDLLDSAAIARLTVTGKARDLLGRSVADTRIAAGSFGKVKIKRAALDGPDALRIGAADWSGARVAVNAAGQRGYLDLEDLLARAGVSADSPLLYIA